jgi:hypothetical protein
MLKLNLDHFFVVKRGLGRALRFVSSVGCMRARALCHAAVAAVSPQLDACVHVEEEKVVLALPKPLFFFCGKTRVG